MHIRLCFQETLSMSTAGVQFVHLVFFFLKILFIYSWKKERERGRDTGRGRSRLHAGSRMQDSIPGPQDHALGWRRRWTAEPPRDPPPFLFVTHSSCWLPCDPKHANGTFTVFLAFLCALWRTFLSDFRVFCRLILRRESKPRKAGYSAQLQEVGLNPGILRAKPASEQTYFMIPLCMRFG